jgi:hypothetical protein
VQPGPLFVLTGALWFVRSLVSFGDPSYYDPRSAFDWFAVLSFSAALGALAFALPALARVAGGRATRIAAAAAAAGAAIGAVGNIVEDGLAQGWAGTGLYLPGVVLLTLGLLGTTITIAVSARGADRLLALAPAATFLGFGLLESGGGALVLGGWAGAAVLSRRRRAPSALDPEPALEPARP